MYVTCGVARSSSDQNALRYVLPVFVDEVMFSYNWASRRQSLKSSIALLVFAFIETNVWALGQRDHDVLVRWCRQFCP